jgi:hypothetical protein
MYSPSRKVRASVRRTLWLLIIGFLAGLVLIETVFELDNSSRETQYKPTVSAGRMLTRSQMLLAKEILLEPTLFSCRSKINKTSTIYPIYMIVRTKAASSGTYFQKRMFTRTSWASEARSFGIPVIYALGRTDDEQIQKMLEIEHQTYGDLLQFNFIDAYYNITIKSAAVLNWFSIRGCHHITPYVFFVDDDVVINFPLLLKMISKNIFNNNTLYGQYLADIEPHPSGKWALSLNDYPNRTYPSFIVGSATLYPSKIIDKIVEKLFSILEENKPMLFLDDVLITGMIAEELGIERAHMFGLVECLYTDLLSKTIIIQCNDKRQILVWSKFIFSRIGQNTLEIDRLINTTTKFDIWRGDFKHTRNGTAIIPINKLNKSILFILTDYHPRISFIVLLIIIIILFIWNIILKRISSRQSPIINNKSPLISMSSGSTSSMLLAPVK